MDKGDKKIKANNAKYMLMFVMVYPKFKLFPEFSSVKSISTKDKSIIDYQMVVLRASDKEKKWDRARSWYAASAYFLFWESRARAVKQTRPIYIEASFRMFEKMNSWWIN